MSTSYEQAEAHVEELTAKRESWALKQTQLVNARTDLQRSAGAAALQGTPTAKIADQMTRLGAEIDIATSVLSTLETQIAAAQVEVHLARIADERTKVVAEFEQAAAVVAKAKPHIDALEQIEGVRYSSPGSRSIGLHMRAYERLRKIDFLEGRLPDDVRAALLAQRDTTPTDVDQKIYAFEYPHAEVPA
jgi:hypothetical protein